MDQKQRVSQLGRHVRVRRHEDRRQFFAVNMPVAIDAAGLWPLRKEQAAPGEEIAVGCE